MSPRIQVLPTVPQIHSFLLTSYNHHSSAKATFHLNYRHGLLNGVLVPKPTVFAMGQQRELLQLCDSRIWNPAVFANALGIKSTPNCYITCKTGPAFVWPSASTVHHTTTTLVCFQFPATPGPWHTLWTLSPYSFCTTDFHSAFRPPLLHVISSPSLSWPSSYWHHLPCWASFCPAKMEAPRHRVSCVFFITVTLGASTQ